jgi:Peptidase family M28
MQASEIAAHLEGFTGRGAGTDAERRAAQWLARELRGSGRQVTVEAFWCRPSWAFAHSWHLTLAIAGSLASLASPTVGGALVLVSLLSVIADTTLGISIGRRLTPERASQNVLARPAAASDGARTTLILAANYDAGRAGLAYRDRTRRATAALRRASAGLTPGWLGWLAIADLWLLATAILRIAGHHSHLISVAQFPPTAGLLLGLAVLLELATAEFGPAAGDNGTGVGVAMAIARALDVAPPRNLNVELVLEGAGDQGQIGMRRYLRRHRGELSRANSVVLGVAACGRGAPRWWSSDGSLLPRHFTPQLRRLAKQVAADESYLEAAPHAGRGSTPALPARSRRLPSLTIGCLDRRGLAPRSHQRGDTAETIDTRAIDGAVQFGLMLIDAIDAKVATTRAAGSPTPA